MTDGPKIAAVIPCFRVRDHVLDVIAAVPPAIDMIYCVDDACPQRSGDLVDEQCRDARVTVLRHARNQGVGGAMVTGYAAALADGADIVVKIDGDGQARLEQLDALLRPILGGRADYAKGNRFYFLDDLEGMPTLRKIGNGVLSLLNKVSSGYWPVFDPTNGFTAIHRSALSRLRLDGIARGYFFESDLLHYLYLARAVVADVPIKAKYAGEVSSLRVHATVLPFLAGHARNLVRLLYTYLVRDLNMASLEFLLSIPLLAGGVAWTLVHWRQSVVSGIPATAGETLIGALPIIVGFQMLLAAVQFDTQNVPAVPLQVLDGVSAGEPGARNNHA